MKEKNTIIIYEKESKLNRILEEQISKLDIYEVYSTTNPKKLLELLEKIKFNALILNLNDLNQELKIIIQNYVLKRNFNYVLGYCDENSLDIEINDITTKILKKPFKIKNLLNELATLLNPKFSEKKEIFITDHLKFLPFQRVLYNLQTDNKEHLTEKENKLFLYIYSNKDGEITKNDLLSEIWGVTEKINTHTIESHIYRLKQKLQKIESNITLLNQNGLYTINFENLVK
ncbi:winged helix-turn-helix domain-containing protein [Alphaproteobacteria bacterium]|nr:winged helix-turn-helix domain-containing protein [Alphaproteobacteria bacterium]